MPPVPAARQHCWVNHTPQTGGPHPGLVLGWRREPDGTWTAKVVYVVSDVDALVQEWLPAHRLTPIANPAKVLNQTRPK